VTVNAAGLKWSQARQSYANANFITLVSSKGAVTHYTPVLITTNK
jgi:hypothetical protein